MAEYSAFFIQRISQFAIILIIHRRQQIHVCLESWLHPMLLVSSLTSNTDIGSHRPIGRLRRSKRVIWLNQSGCLFFLGGPVHSIVKGTFFPFSFYCRLLALCVEDSLWNLTVAVSSSAIFLRQPTYTAQRIQHKRLELGFGSFVPLELYLMPIQTSSHCYYWLPIFLVDNPSSNIRGERTILHVGKLYLLKGSMIEIEPSGPQSK